jgi:hypothetical protein
VRSDKYFSILAYAVLTGDRAYATNALLAQRPTLRNDPPYYGSLSGIMIELLERRLAEQDAIIHYFVRDPQTEQRADFLGLLDRLSTHRLHDFRGLLTELASSEDATISQSAAALLARLN